MFDTLPPISHLTDSLNVPLPSLSVRRGPSGPTKGSRQPSSGGYPHQTLHHFPPVGHHHHHTYQGSPGSPHAVGPALPSISKVPFAPVFHSSLPERHPSESVPIAPPPLFHGPSPVPNSLNRYHLVDRPQLPMISPQQYYNDNYRFVSADEEKKPSKRAKHDPHTSVLRFRSDRSPSQFRDFKDSYKQNGKRLFPDSEERFPVTELQDALRVVPPRVAQDLSDHIYPSIITKKYSASALGTNRSHLLVYEYPLATQWVIWDYETGYTHLTGLWRAALHEQALHRNKNGVVHVKPNAKADIVKLLESTPQALHPYIKRVRGGFLKIQGTWVPHSLCKRLARSFCYYIRYQLIPIFGTDFPDLCLHPDDPGFGELRFDVCGDSSDFSIDTTSAGSESCPISPTSESPMNGNNNDTNYSNPKTYDTTRSGSLSSTYSRSSNETNSLGSAHSSATSISVNSVSQSTSQSPNQPVVRQDDKRRLSYADIVDIVNASKCLQRLRQGSCSEEGDS
ncbi:hypothetical protein CJJ07_001280 [Candidozyma auris]|nr:hypothetical protein CJJ07_001280 [[Candida] auris]QEL58874.1 hypothetical protein CJJ09_000927 [[Candida] auris]